ncbi:hypothetical protein Rhopal_005695-T1 [Rhodotorula paludigena]|uniref:R3H-associated N-terminal domain-containing protein n=1 Tax=Rhodotorula paludigena TaxID=86838 RepID=A0AAV5GJ84_9BASI|nr:hypothetical protein Rhopal_005695-T1 [Rhodotorula paludigena]
MSDLHAEHARALASGPLDAPVPVLAASSSSSSRTTTATASASSAASALPGAVPMRIPAILRVQGAKQGGIARKERGDEGAAAAAKAGGRGGAGGSGPGGKRRKRRWENAQLAGNPHLHRPTRADFSPGPYLKDLTTTFSPPPSAFSRSTYISSSPASAPSRAALASAASHGQFTMSLRGLRRTLRSSLGVARGAAGGASGGGRTEEVLARMENELCAWLSLSGRIPEGFFHDSVGPFAGSVGSLAQACARGKTLDPTPVDDWVAPPRPAHPTLPDLPTRSSAALSSDAHLDPPPPTLTELARQPHALVWLAPSPHHRFLLHALARYYNLSSFSRPLSPLEPDIRVTHVLKPQMARGAAGRGAGASAGHDTPPGTDWTFSSAGSSAAESATEGFLSSATEGEFTSADEGSAAEYDTDEDAAASVLGGEVNMGQGDDWEAVSAGRPVLGGTDDEAEAVYSSTETDETESDDAGVAGDRDDDNDAASDAGTGVDSLASSFADLAAAESSGDEHPAPSSGAATPLRRAPAAAAAFSPSSHGTATPRAPFSPFVPSSLGTPASASDPSRTPLALRPLDRPRGRASLGTAAAPAEAGYASSAVESSPSRSPTRSRGAFIGAALGEWRLPEKGFLEWLYA